MGRWTNIRMRCMRLRSHGGTALGGDINGGSGCFHTPSYPFESFRHGGGCSASSRSLRAGCTKTYLVILNFVFLLGGSTLLGVGLWMSVERQSVAYVRLFHTLPPSASLIFLFQKLPSLCVLLGGSVAILSFLGCCGACANSACFLSIFVLLLCLLLLTEIIVVGITTTYKDKIVQTVELALQYQIRHEYNKTGRPINSTVSRDTDYITVVVDVLQTNLNCCGASGPEDYHHSVWFNRSRHVDEVFVPVSCCVPAPFLPAAAGQTSGGDRGDNVLQRPSRAKDENLCQINAILYIQPDFNRHLSTTLPELKTQGCTKSLVQWLYRNTFYIVCLSIIVVSLQILDLFSACVLMSWVRQKHSDCGSIIDDTEFG